MMVSVEVPLFGEAFSDRMFGSKWTIASELREYDVLELLPHEGSRVLSLRPAKDQQPVDFHLLEGASYRDTGIELIGVVHRLSINRDTRTVHPFFERAFAAMSPKLKVFEKLGKTDLKNSVLPAGLAEALHAGGPSAYTPNPAEGSPYEWWGAEEKAIAIQKEAFDSWMSRFVSVGGRLMLREDVPMLVVGGEPDFPTFEVVWGDDVREPVSMNTSIGFMPKTFGYFGLEEFGEAVDFATVVGGGWLSDPDVSVDMVSPLIPTRPYADMSLIDVAEGMRKRFIRRIASVSHDPVESFSEMEDALASIDVATFKLFKELVNGIAEWNDKGALSRIVAVLPAILDDQNARKVFFVTERLASIADEMIRRWDARPVDVMSIAA
jgi:hypothetical protein